MFTLHVNTLQLSCYALLQNCRSTNVISPEQKKDCFHIRIRNTFDRQVLYSLSAIKYIDVRQHEDSKVLKKNLEPLTVPTLYILKLCEILVR